MLSSPPEDLRAPAPIVAAIPARFGSERFPGKPLAPLWGKPLVLHAWERAQEAGCFKRVVILTDDLRILEAARSFGAEAELTPSELASGTDRIACAARAWSCLGVVNVQGDEPTVAPQDLARVAQQLVSSTESRIVTLATAADPADQADPNAVKVVVDLTGRALYFSRAPIPYQRVSHATPVWKHVGVYGYPRDLLLHLAALERTPLETAENLEQLRALEHGIPIQVLTGARPSVGVDTPADLERLERSGSPFPEGARS